MPSPPQLPPFSSFDSARNSLPQLGPSHYDPHHPVPSASTSINSFPLFHSLSSSDTTGGSRHDQPSSSSNLDSQVSGSDEVEQTKAEYLEIAEEKRRRNTAASARFRIKKKHKTISLERSVSDLTGRAEELEREAADLRRENGWLKEIVMLKGTHFAASNAAHRQALSEAASLAISEAANATVDQTGKLGS